MSSFWFERSGTTKLWPNAQCRLFPSHSMHHAWNSVSDVRHHGWPGGVPKMINPCMFLQWLMIISTLWWHTRILATIWNIPPLLNKCVIISEATFALVKLLVADVSHGIIMLKERGTWKQWKIVNNRILTMSAWPSLHSVWNLTCLSSCGRSLCPVYRIWKELKSWKSLESDCAITLNCQTHAMAAATSNKFRDCNKTGKYFTYLWFST